jgi:uncharacterized membrane protein
MTAAPMMSLLGVAVVIVGLVARFNPILVVTAGALVTGIAGGLDPVSVVSALGKGFNDSRFISVAFLVLPVIGLLERAGLQARARSLISRITAVTAGRLLITYLAVRQLTAAVGLLALGGQASMVRPLIAPMARGAAESRLGPLPEDSGRLIDAHAAGVDNVGAFFGEDIFIALGSVLLIQAVLLQNKLSVEPLRIALWGIPTALAAFTVHAFRLVLLDRRLARGSTEEPRE